MLLFNYDHAGALPFIGENIHAAIGNPFRGRDHDLFLKKMFGTCGFGPRNGRGWIMVCLFNSFG